MSGVKHTPGPLAIFPERDRQWLWVMDALGTKRVARVVLYDGLEDEMEANARLIAAAPDLLEAAQNAVEEWGMRAGDDDALLPSSEQPESIAALMRAIARARGEQDGGGS